MFFNDRQNKDLSEKLVKLVVPIAIQQFMLALVSATDAMMLGFVDQASLSAVPLGFIAAFVFNAPVWLVYIIISLDELVKLPAVYIHYKKYVWVRNITR